MTGGPPDVLAAAVQLQRDGTPFVLATVVRAERPTSARPGAKAIVLSDGSASGFVGGSCVRPAVRRESLLALADGRPRLLRISPDASNHGPQEGVREERMACLSGGAIDIHLEPYLPSRRLVVSGVSPVVEALRALGGALGMKVDGDGEVEREVEGAFVVVAGHGEGEEEILEAALSDERAAWVGLVASPRRAAGVREALRARGLSEAEVERLRSPAGLDIGAETPGEIALSILAQIVEDRERPAPPVSDDAVDPVCGMTVSRDSPHCAERDGETFWFCCHGCAAAFEAREAETTT